MSEGLIGYHYDPEYGVSKVQQEQQVLHNAHNRLVNATDPWHAFYYMIAEHLDVTALAKLGSQVDMLSEQLTQMSWYAQEVEKMKAAFFSVQEGGASGIDNPDQTFKQCVARFINALIGSDVLPNGGSDISYQDLQNALAQVGSSSNTKLYSPQAITQMINTVINSFQSTKADGGILGGTTTLSAIWAQAESQSTTVGGQTTKLPYPQALQGYVDGMSTLGGYTKGVSGIETQKLNYTQKRYFLVSAFLKSLFGYFYHQSKTPVGKERSY